MRSALWVVCMWAGVAAGQERLRERVEELEGEFAERREELRGLYGELEALEREVERLGEPGWEVVWEQGGDWLVGAVSPGGERLALGSLSGEVRVVSPRSGEELWRGRVGGGLPLLDWSGDGRWLAGVQLGEEGSFVVWDAEGRERSRRASDLSFGLAWDPTRARLALLQFGRTEVYDAGGALLERLERRAYDVAWSPDGSRLALATLDGLEVWDASTWRVLVQAESSGPIPTVEWGPGGRELVGATATWVGVWDARSGALLRELGVSAEQARVAVSREGVVAIGDTEALRLYDLELVLRAELEGAGVWPAFSRDGRWLLARGERAMRLWGRGGVPAAVARPPVVPEAPEEPEVGGIVSRELVLRLETGSVLDVAWSDDGTRLVTGGFEGEVSVWDAEEGRREWSERLETSRGVWVAWSGGEVGGATVLEGSLAVWSERGEGRGRGQVEFLSGVCADPRGGVTASGMLATERWESGGMVRRWEGFGGLEPRWDRAGERLAFGDGSEVEVRDRRGRAVVRLAADDQVTGVAWSPDGAQLLGATESVVWAWSVETGEVVHRLEVGGVESGAGADWSPDGRRWVVGTGGGVMEFDARAGAPAWVYGEGEAGWAPRFSPDGGRLAICTDQGVEVWRVSGE